MARLLLTAVTALATVVACGGGASSPFPGNILPDAGSPDSGTPDAGAPDAGPAPDAGTGCVPNGTRVTHASPINATETWAGDGVTHAVPNDLSINGTAVVRIQPCAFVEMGPNASITLYDSASLVAAGTSDTRYVAFYRASPTQPWGILRGARSTTRLDLSYTVLQGGGAYGGQFDDPTIAMAGNGYGQPIVPNLRVNVVVIDGPKNVGVFLDTGAAFTSDSQGLGVLGAPGYPVEATMMAAGSLPSGKYDDPSNGKPFLNVIGSAAVFADLTLRNFVPIRIPFDEVVVESSTGAAVTLTIEPGSTLAFPRTTGGAPGGRMTFGASGNPPNKVGTLVAVGTAAAPIRFTSAERAPQAGDWTGIWLRTATGSLLDHVVIEYAGAYGTVSVPNCKPAGTHDDAALLIGNGTAEYVPGSSTFTNGTIQFSAGFGIDALWANSSVNTPKLDTGNTFTGNARCAQTFNAPLTGGCPSLGCTIQ